MYPLCLTLSTRGEPFSMVELSCLAGYLPSKVSVQLSDNGEVFNTVGELRFSDETEQGKEYRIRTLRLGKIVSAQYLRLSMSGSAPNKDNLCKQVALGGVAAYQVKFPDTQYLYNIESAHEYPKGMLELLRCLEWKKLQAKAEANLDICI